LSLSFNDNDAIVAMKHDFIAPRVEQAANNTALEGVADGG
jgi:hypothetical protein